MRLSAWIAVALVLAVSTAAVHASRPEDADTVDTTDAPKNTGGDGAEEKAVEKKDARRKVKPPSDLTRGTSTSAVKRIENTSSGRSGRKVNIDAGTLERVEEKKSDSGKEPVGSKSPPKLSRGASESTVAQDLQSTRSKSKKPTKMIRSPRLDAEEKEPVSKSKSRKKLQRQDSLDRLLKLQDLNWVPTGDAFTIPKSVYAVKQLPQGVAPDDDAPAKVFPGRNAVGKRAPKKVEQKYPAKEVVAAYSALYPDVIGAPPAIVIAMDLLVSLSDTITTAQVFQKLFRQPPKDGTLFENLKTEFLNKGEPKSLLRIVAMLRAKQPVKSDVAVALAWAINWALNQADLPPLFPGELQDKLATKYGAGGFDPESGHFTAPLRDDRIKLHKVLAKYRPKLDARVWNIVDIVLMGINNMCQDFSARGVDPARTTPLECVKYFAPMVARGFFRRSYGGKGKDDPEDRHLNVFLTVANTLTQALIIDWPTLLVAKPENL